MRCPYCGTINAEKANFCVNCRQSLVPPTIPNRAAQTQNQQSPFLPRPNTRPNVRREPVPSFTPPPLTPPQQFGVRPKAPVQQTPRTSIATPQTQTMPEAPTAFPPKNMEQLRELEKEAIAYTVTDEIMVAGRKKTVRIVFNASYPWQQVGTLMKAFDDLKLGNSFSLVIIQGSQNKDESLYDYTNGQLQFDRDARLGSQVLRRYQIQTGNGFENDSLRILLEEK